MFLEIILPTYSIFNAINESTYSIFNIINMPTYSIFNAIVFKHYCSYRHKPANHFLPIGY